MTTALLNSVDSYKAGVASAVNVAVREVGAAFSIAVLGTSTNQGYQKPPQLLRGSPAAA